RRLGDAALAVWFVRDGRLAAVTRVAGRSRLHRLGAESEVRSSLDRILFAARRLAREGPGERLPGTLTRLIGDAATALSDAVFGGLDELRDRDLVLVPPPFLHATPWHELPGLAARPVTVAASVRQWLRAVEAPPRGGGTAVVAGPSLPGALAEAGAIASLYGVTPRVGAEATVPRVLADLAAADLVHLATHGWLRADNPQFSELTLSDGELMVHHLDIIDRLPSTLILACCDTGRPVTLPGEGMLGFAAACLVRGVRTLIAPVAPVPDGATAGVMIALHERLRSGVPPARALAEAQRDQPPGHRAIVCFGTGSL
ncbi:MAG: CHAT domain-containing protein, partial [Propionibacterium sp.]|nr:CHAT domain-containing protein [Propionibacterium sp.]